MIDMPVPSKSSSSFWARSSAGSGRAAGPALKLMCLVTMAAQRSDPTGPIKRGWDRVGNRTGTPDPGPKLGPEQGQELCYRSSPGGASEGERPRGWVDPLGFAQRAGRRAPFPVTSGAEGDRTPDLCIANAALSQLSYSPGRWERGLYTWRRGAPSRSGDSHAGELQGLSMISQSAEDPPRSRRITGGGGRADCIRSKAARSARVARTNLSGPPIDPCQAGLARANRVPAMQPSYGCHPLMPAMG